MIVQIYPLLAAGCEATEKEDRQWVEERWQAMASRMWIGNIDRCWEVMQEVWTRRDEAQAAKIAAEKAKQRPGMVHSESSKRKFEEEVSEGFSFEDMLSGKRQRTNFSGPGFERSMMERKRVHEPAEEDVDSELGVRGRLHWVSVMKEWEWESKSIFCSIHFISHFSFLHVWYMISIYHPSHINTAFKIKIQENLTNSFPLQFFSANLLRPQPLQTRHLPQPHLHPLYTPTRLRPLHLLPPIHHRPLHPPHRNLRAPIPSHPNPQPNIPLPLPSRWSKPSPPRVLTQTPSRLSPPLFFSCHPRAYHISFAFLTLDFGCARVVDKCFEGGEAVWCVGEPA